MACNLGRDAQRTTCLTAGSSQNKVDAYSMFVGTQRPFLLVE